jgi:hypothetical protein
MATLFEACSRFALRHSPAASADAVATISRSMRRAYTAFNSAPYVEAPRAFGADLESPTSALWILHAR